MPADVVDAVSEDIIVSLATGSVEDAELVKVVESVLAVSLVIVSWLLVIVFAIVSKSAQLPGMLFNC